MFQFTPRRPRGKHSLTSPSVKVSEINQLSRPPRAAAAVQSARLQSQTLRHQEVAMKASPLLPQAGQRGKPRTHARTRKLNCESCGTQTTHHAGRAARATARRGVECANLAKDALEKHSWGEILERQRNAKKFAAITMLCNGPKSSRALAF